MSTVTAKIKLNTKTAAEWGSSGVILLVGEVGIDSTNHIIKVGDGSSTWNNLPVMGYATSAQVAAKQDLITSSNKLSASLVSGLSDVATSGSYNDLSNTPTVPTKTSDLTNDSNFITLSDITIIDGNH